MLMTIFKLKMSITNQEVESLMKRYFNYPIFLLFKGRLKPDLGLVCMPSIGMLTIYRILNKVAMGSQNQVRRLLAFDKLVSYRRNDAWKFPSRYFKTSLPRSCNVQWSRSGLASCFATSEMRTKLSSPISCHKSSCVGEVLCGNCVCVTMCVCVGLGGGGGRKEWGKWGPDTVWYFV